MTASRTNLPSVYARRVHVNTPETGILYKLQHLTRMNYVDPLSASSATSMRNYSSAKTNLTQQQHSCIARTAMSTGAVRHASRVWGSSRKESLYPFRPFSSSRLVSGHTNRFRPLHDLLRHRSAADLSKKCSPDSFSSLLHSPCPAIKSSRVFCSRRPLWLMVNLCLALPALPQLHRAPQVRQIRDSRIPTLLQHKRTSIGPSLASLWRSPS